MARTSISVTEGTKRMLDAIRQSGQSYEGIIEELAEEQLALSEEAVESIERGVEQLQQGQSTAWPEE